MDHSGSLPHKKTAICRRFSKDVVVDLYSGLSYHEKKLQGFKAGPKKLLDVWKPVSC